MKNIINHSFSFVMALGLSACVSTPEQTQKVLEDHPEILFNIIEKNPEQFMKTVQKAALKSQYIQIVSFF